MAFVMICDLCGLPIVGLDGDGVRRFKVKEFGATPFDFSWRKLDCHNKCVQKLLSATETQMEVTDDA